MTKKILHGVELIIVLFITALSLLNFFSSADGIGLFGFKGYTVLSDSMSPTFQKGDYIIIRTGNYAALGVSDIATFSYNQYIITHRVSRATDGGFKTKGDLNKTEDSSLLNSNNYIGTWLITIPKIGFLLIFLQNPIIYSLIVAAVIVRICYGFFAER